ncbi:MAG TPA: hypothetical protein PKZ08_08665 [Vicinamibacterales bacterium]|nr:hypothetical protein [Vicinamibacterales bacterium]
MAQTRRTFLQSAAMAIGATGVPLAAGRQRPPAASAAPDGQAGSGAPRPQAAQGATARQGGQPAKPLTPASQLQVPKMSFGGQQISRLIVGCNPFYGFSHFNNTYSQVMREYYTAERVCEVLHQCARFGINTYNYVELGRAAEDLARFQAEGGSMHLIVQGIGDPAPLHAAWKPLAIYHHGGRTDTAYMSGKIETVRDWCKQVRDLGCLVGVGSHKPEVLALVEDQGWDVDFYAGCVYNITRTNDEWRKVLGGELLEMPSEIYLQSDPPRMYRFMQQTKKPCFAYKILAAGRVGERAMDEAFRTAFASIKPTDGVFVGMFPRVRDEVRENAERVCRILKTA